MSRRLLRGFSCAGLASILLTPCQAACTPLSDPVREIGRGEWVAAVTTYCCEVGGSNMHAEQGY